jgi:RNA polymerase sigma factor (sigma-70 family)
MDDDVTLLRRFAQTRGEDAFAELVRRHVDAIYSFAVRRVGGDAHLAEEVVQDVFITLARQAASVSRHPLLIGWLFRTTRNLAANAVRSDRRRRAHEMEIQCMEAENVDRDIEWSQLAPLLDGALEKLGERDRTVILLRFVQRQTFATIGRTLNLTEDGARKRVERALAKLQGVLARGGFVSSGTLATTLMANAVSPAPAGLAVSATVGAVTAANAAVSVTLMATSKLVGVGLAATLALLCLRFGLEQNERRVELLQAIEGARRDIDQLERASAQKMSAPSNLMAVTTAVTPVAKGAAALVTTPPNSNSGAPTDKVVTLTRTVAEPTVEARRACYDARKAALHMELIDLYSRFITPAETDRLATIGADVQANDNELGICDFAQLYADPAAFGEFRNQAEPLLGPERWRQFELGIRKASAHYLTGEFAATVARIDPLQRSQADALVETIAAASPPFATGGVVDSANLDWDVIQRKAQLVLSPVQLQSLQDLRAMNEYAVTVDRIRNHPGK